MVMQREDIIKSLHTYIDTHAQDMLEYVMSLIRLPSPMGQPTYAQELVAQTLKEMGFSIDLFPGDLQGTQKYADYCPLPGDTQEDRALNLVGKKKGGKAPSLMLFSHVDTEAPYEGDPYIPRLEGGRIWGLGAADAKGGLATILMAMKALLATCPGEIPGDLLMMSVLGKRGGAAGALTAIHKGYTAQGAIYLHSAETGHGFREIKNYSMGILDCRVLVSGQEGIPFVDLDDSEVNAIKKGMKVVEALKAWDAERKKRLVFTEGSFSGQPMTKLHLGRIQAGDYVGKDPLSFALELRLYFPLGETVQGVLKELQEYLQEATKEDLWLAEHPPRVQPMYIRANPAETSADSPLIKIVEQNIEAIKGPQDFIYQYHGASDIRFPILYLGIPAVGIGSLAGGFSQEEWLDTDDYICGIKILAQTILDWWEESAESLEGKG